MHGVRGRGRGRGRGGGGGRGRGARVRIRGRGRSCLPRKVCWPRYTGGLGSYGGGMPAEEGLLAVLVGVEVVHQSLELHESAVAPPGASDLQT